MIVKGLEVGMYMSNCYIVGSEKTLDGMVIDPGGEAGRILETARDLGLSVRIIVATHLHLDHIGAVAEVKEATGAQFAAHESAGSGKGAQTVNRMVASMMGGSFRAPPQPDRLLREGDSVEVGELRFKVMHTPGHSPEGICLYGHGVLFCGDTLFNLSIGRTDFPGGDYDQLMGNIHKKLMTLPDETRVLCGHMSETTIGFERKHNPFVLGLY